MRVTRSKGGTELAGVDPEKTGIRGVGSGMRRAKLAVSGSLFTQAALIEAQGWYEREVPRLGAIVVRSRGAQRY